MHWWLLILAAVFGLLARYVYTVVVNPVLADPYETTKVRRTRKTAGWLVILVTAGLALMLVFQAVRPLFE